MRMSTLVHLRALSRGKCYQLQRWARGFNSAWTLLRGHRLNLTKPWPASFFSQRHSYIQWSDHHQSPSPVSPAASLISKEKRGGNEHQGPSPPLRHLGEKAARRLGRFRMIGCSEMALILWCHLGFFFVFFFILHTHILHTNFFLGNIQGSGLTCLMIIKRLWSLHCEITVYVV